MATSDALLATQQNFDRYEVGRPRLPQVSTGPDPLDSTSPLDIAEKIDAFVFDALGVLNVGETLISNAGAHLYQQHAAINSMRLRHPYPDQRHWLRPQRCNW